MDIEQKNELKTKMDKAIAVLDKELAGLRAGRASTSLLDPVVVEVYGSKMPISQVGTLSAPDPKTLTVQVWDQSLVKTVEKAIVDANLGLNPNADGQLIRMSLPVVSEERRKELAKLASKYGENTKVALRNIRRDGMDVLKKSEKAGEISEDEHHRYSEEVNELTEQYTKKVDNTVQNKEKEILAQ